jgi:DNA-binding NarL/FixJ family response regulator
VVERLQRPGACIKDVAHELGISDSAARARLHSLYVRLGVCRLTDAIAVLRSAA